MQVFEPPDRPWSDQPLGALAQMVGFAEEGLISDGFILLSHQMSCLASGWKFLSFTIYSFGRRDTLLLKKSVRNWTDSSLALPPWGRESSFSRFPVPSH